MSSPDAPHRFLALTVLILSLSACGGDSGTDPSPDADPTPAERTEMAASLTDAAAAAAASGDELSGTILSGAASMVQNGLAVTAGIRSSARASASSGSTTAGARSAARVFTIAVGVEMLNDPSPITGYSGAIVINGTTVAFGLGESSFGTFPTTALGGIGNGPNQAWVATAGTVGGLIQSLGPVGCGVNLPSPVVQCQPGTYKLVSLEITQSTPMNFQGNTATGSNTFLMPSRTPVAGVEVTVDCNLTTFC